MLQQRRLRCIHWHGPQSQAFRVPPTQRVALALRISVLDAVQADLVSSLDQLGEEQDDSEEGLYTHLDDVTRIARLESDRVFGAEDEPSHIAPENKLGGDQVDD